MENIILNNIEYKLVPVKKESKTWITVFAYIIAFIGDSIDSNIVLFKHKKK